MEARMTQTTQRPWLITALSRLFADESIKKKYVASTKKKIADKQFERIFDDFDFVIQDSELEQFAKKYVALLANIKRFKDDLGDVANLNKTQTTYMDNLLNGLINIGIDELFAGPNQIHSELIELLAWQDVQDKLGQVELLCAFVGTVFQCMVVKYPKSIDEFKNGRECADIYLNKNYRRLVKEALLARGFLKESDEVDLSPGNLFKSPVAIAATAVTTVGVLATLIALGIHFFTRAGDKASEAGEKKEKPKPG